MNNAWTGGQYSFFRALLGAYLLLHFAQLLPYGAELFSSAGVLSDASLSPLARAFPNVLLWLDGPAWVSAWLAAGVGLSALFALGIRDRIAALALWYLWACLFGRNPLIANPSIPYVGFMLVAHALLPKAPYGSIAARGRVDPNGGWQMPRGIYFAAWVALAAGYTYSGSTKLASPSWLDGSAIERVLSNPLARPGYLGDALLALPDTILRAMTWGALAMEISFAPLALFRRLRPWLWTAMLSMHLGLIALIDFADLSIAMVLVHAFTFDPAWIPARAGKAGSIFYDGGCGLCHRFVRFVLAEDRSDQPFRFAPLAGDTFASKVPLPLRAELPDSVIVLTPRGELLQRSAAAIHVLDHLGGMWRAIAFLLRLVPRPLRDLGYDAVASVRKRVFAPPSGACPLAPPKLAARLDP